MAVAEPVTEEPVEAAAEEPAEPVAEEPAKPAKPVAPVLVQAVDVEKDRLFVAGKGEPGAKVRIYIDGDFKGEATVAPQGTFLLELAQGLESGRHQLRADMLEGGGSTVSSRAQVAVDHEPEPPQQVAQTEEPEVETPQVAAVETPEPAKPVEAVETPVVEESAEEPVQTAATETVEEPVITTGRSVIIRRGDNLWRISRRMLGEGRRYTLIFEANTDQIRNPDLIYPGQVFEVPGEEDTAGTAQSSSG